jgi:glutathione S-transferase
VNSELHKNFGPLFQPGTTDEAKATARANVLKRLALVEQTLAGQPCLTGADFTVADAYLYVTLSWTGLVGIDLDGLPNVQAFYARSCKRPAVIAARQDEGLPA